MRSQSGSSRTEPRASRAPFRVAPGPARRQPRRPRRVATGARAGTRGRCGRHAGRRGRSGTAAAGRGKYSAAIRWRQRSGGAGPGAVREHVRATRRGRARPRARERLADADDGHAGGGVDQAGQRAPAWALGETDLRVSSLHGRGGDPVGAPGGPAGVGAPALLGGRNANAASGRGRRADRAAARRARAGLVGDRPARHLLRAGL